MAKYKTREFLLAQLEALDAKNIELERLCTSLRSERDEFKAECRNLQSMVNAYMHAAHQKTVDTGVVTFNALSERAKRLNAAGVPAVIHRGQVLHARTRAVIKPGDFDI